MHDLEQANSLSLCPLTAITELLPEHARRCMPPYVPHCGHPLVWPGAPLPPALVPVFESSQLSRPLGPVMVTARLCHFCTISEGPGPDLPMGTKETCPVTTQNTASPVSSRFAQPLIGGGRKTISQQTACTWLSIREALSGKNGLKIQLHRKDSNSVSSDDDEEEADGL